MADTTKEQDAFDVKLAAECAGAYTEVSGLGCTVSNTEGTVLFESGHGCGSCGACVAAGFNKEECVRAHAYGMAEAERFGGKYIYFCPLGLTCFVSPIIGRLGSAAKITVGPFLMVDREDYVTFDLMEKLGLSEEAAQRVLQAIERYPVVSSSKVTSLSNLLFMAVGFMNNVSTANRMLEIQDSEAIQGQISEYILSLKADESAEYPIKTEKALLASLAEHDKAKAQKLLNELLGFILFSSGGDFARIKSRIFELLVLMSRAAIDAGAAEERTFRLNHGFFQKAQNAVNIDTLCLLLTEVMNKYIDSIFDFSDVKDADVIYKAVHFMRQNYAQKVTLEDVARVVCLSPAYFSKVFRREMGRCFNDYLNDLRIEKSKRLLLQTEMNLIHVAGATGFMDQSYFSKVFRRAVGVSPHQFRKTGGRM